MSFHENLSVEVTFNSPDNWTKEVGVGPFAAQILRWDVQRARGEDTQVLFSLAEPKSYQGLMCVYFLARPRIIGESLRDLMRGWKVVCTAIRVSKESIHSVDIFDRGWVRQDIRVGCILSSLELRGIEFSIDETFSHSYAVHQLSEMPDDQTILRYAYPGASVINGYDYHGIPFQIQATSGKPWIGVFDNIHKGVYGHGISGVFTTPDSHHFSVVIDGEARIVSTTVPTDWEDICVVPVTDVRPVPSRGLLIFVSSREIAAYDKNGLRWQTGKFAFDGMTITEVTDVMIKGEYGNPPDGTGFFIIDLDTGALRGT